MGIEDFIAANTAALDANTKALTASLEANATASAPKAAAATGDAGSAGAKGGRPPKETAAQKKKREAAERKAAEDETAAGADEAEGEDEDAIAPRKSITIKALGKIMGEWMEVDDEDVAEAREEQVVAAFDHLGVSNLGEITDADELRQLALYVDNWIAGNDVDFDALDELVQGEDVAPKAAGKKKKKSLLG